MKKRLKNIFAALKLATDGKYQQLRALKFLRAAHIPSDLQMYFKRAYNKAMIKRQLKEGDLLTLEGDQSDQIFYVESGELEAYRYQNDQKVVLGHVRSGEIAGEIAFIDQKKRSATLRATEKCYVIEIPRKSFESTLDNLPPWLQALVQNLCRRLRESNKKT